VLGKGEAGPIGRPSLFAHISSQNPHFTVITPFLFKMLWRSACQISFCLFSLAAGVAAEVAGDTHRPIIYLIRHGEKSGDPNDHELTYEGIMRAECLRDFFGADSGYNISYILAPAMEKSK
jgi:hypothetical protein